ncbi:E3 ubiquitin-protein ligase Rnf220-like isoform X2 [Dreissena polymorpha]|nr:E3 ubiquitin-protein ligase Rnf220-like isoform X2 [Dreissena polymorpha]
MDSFIPNPMGSPALMVLASTAENHEGSRLNGTPRFTNPDSKEGSPQFTTPNFTMYRPGEHFPSPIYAPVHPLVRAGVRSDRSGVGIMHPAGSSAFRHVSGENTLDQFHSAFSPAKRPKPEDLSKKSHTASNDSNHNHNESICEDRPSSQSSVNYETNSDSYSEHGDRGTPDSEGRSLRKQRKKIVLDGQTPHCPICGLTLRPGEADSHLQAEVEKLEKLSTRGVRKSRETTPQGRKMQPSPSSCRGKDSPGLAAASHARYENYLRIQCNRQSRLGARSRSRKKRQEETVCPVCNKKVTGTPEELNEHVELCLKKRDEEDGVMVDVETDGEDNLGYEEYTWAGQTRIRASTMLDGGYAGTGFQVAGCSSEGLDEDADLNVDDDDSEKYGKPQYSEADVIPCASDEPGEDQEREALRGAVLSAADLPSHLSNQDRLVETDIEGAHHPAPGVKVKVEFSEEACIGGSAGQIITALKCKLKDRSREAAATKCLICMEPYSKPVTSTQCWHVHCEECWLRTMGAKKLCPQCNMITSPADLRRIYL